MCRMLLPLAPELSATTPAPDPAPLLGELAMLPGRTPPCARAGVGGAVARRPCGTTPEWPVICYAVDQLMESFREELIGIAQALIRTPSINPPDRRGAHLSAH